MNSDIEWYDDDLGPKAYASTVSGEPLRLAFVNHQQGPHSTPVGQVVLASGNPDAPTVIATLDLGQAVALGGALLFLAGCLDHHSAASRELVEAVIKDQQFYYGFRKAVDK